MQKGKKVVLGGVHPTLMPKEDSLLKDFNNNNLKKYYKGNTNSSLTGLIPARRNLLNRKDYITINSIEASRGCVNQCSFCTVFALNKGAYFMRPVEEVITEISEMKSKELVFIDVNLIADRNYAKSLFQAMIPLKKWWFGLATVDAVNDDALLKLMVRSGCKGLLMGFETIDHSSLKSLNKNRNLQVDYKFVMDKLHDYDIAVNGTFCFGSDDDHPDIFKQTVEAIMKLKIDLPRYSILTPFPGTQLYQQLESENRIWERNWAMYDVQHCVFYPKNMSPLQLEEGNIYAWKETYKYLSISKRLARLSKLFFINWGMNLSYKNYARKLGMFDRKKMTDNNDIPGGTDENNIYSS
jgi:radical SAM superfamily enzyme YgiQ (UPF0313 family)